MMMPRFHFAGYLIPALLLCSSLRIHAQEGTVSPTSDSALKKPVRVYNTTRLVTSRPAVDGKLDDDCWNTGNWASDFIQFMPVEGGKPTYRTMMKILYDDKGLYIAMRAIDKEPHKIQRYAGIRDDITGDIMGVAIDSYHDRRTGFEFDLNAYGQKVDLLLTNPFNWDVNWNAVWKGKTGMEDSAWVIEMEIPLSQLRYSNEKEQVWGLHAWRMIGRMQEESVWEKQTLTGPGFLYNFGELRGISGLKKSARLEIMPYALGQMNTFAKQPGNPFTKDGRSWSGMLGLDAKVGISSNFTMDVTINPDFGQVESDPSVMNLTAFETFYVEKRPFFLEGKTIFEYEFDDLNLFYSRRIGHAPSYSIPSGEYLYSKMPDKTTILDAVKLSGKTANGLSLGILQSITGPGYASISDGDGESRHPMVEPLTNYTVTRVMKDFHEGTTVIGGMFTTTNRFINDVHLETLTKNAYTGGLDLLHQWKDKKYYVDARIVGSYVDGSTAALRLLQESSARYYQRPGADYLPFDTTLTHLNGYGGRAKIGKGTGLWRYFTGVSVFSPGLELNDIGYMQTADAIRQQNQIKYFVNQPVSIFRTYSVSLDQNNDWNFNGDYLGSGAMLNVSSEFLNKWGIRLSLKGKTRQLDTRVLRGGPDMYLPGSFLGIGTFNSDMSKRIAFTLLSQYKHAGENSAKAWGISPGFTLRPVNALKIGLSADFAGNNDLLQYVSKVPASGGDRYVLGNISQQTMGFTFRVDYVITPELSIVFYGSPFVSKGKYNTFKYITDPLNHEFKNRYKEYVNPTLAGGVYQLDENNDGTADYSLANPDFNFHQFRSNLVAKWEFRPGSFLYFVWSSDRTGLETDASSSMGTSFRNMWNVFPGNIFLVKFNYWFSL